MSKGRAKFTQSDVTKAVKGARAAGMAVQRFEIDPVGKIVVIAGPPLQADPESPEQNEWDEVK